MDGVETNGSILDCPMCTDIYDVPRILPCQHTVCERCLSSYIRREVTKKGGQQLRKFPCPVCKRNIKLREASAFQKNLTIVALLDSKLLKAWIQKASAKKKTNSVTIETQTSNEESSVDFTELSESLLQDKTGQCYGGAKYAGNSRDYGHVSVQSKNRRKDVTEDIDNRCEQLATSSLLCSALNGDMAVFVSLLYLVIVFDVILSALVYFLPVLGFLFISSYILFYHSNRSNLLQIQYQAHILKEKRWWHGCLVTNFEWMVYTTNALTQFVYFMLLFNLAWTFFSAISVKQMVFTVDVLYENFSTMVIYIIFMVNDANILLGNSISSIFQNSFNYAGYWLD